MIGLKLYLHQVILVITLALSASFKTIKAQAQVVDNIGDITELNGQAQIVRDKTYDAALKFTIQQNDEAITNNGRMAITFLDESTVRLTEHSQLIVDEYIFDPNPSNSKMALTFGLGTARFITGNLNRIDKQNIKLKTPTANIAIRGTDFTVTVDELGRSLIILLPDALGLSSGEIEVITATGSVLLNKPFEATSVSVFEASPSSPVVLDLTLGDIDNMLIVKAPAEKEAVMQEQTKAKQANLLDFNDLDIDYLEEDFLKEDDLEFTELDINYLDVNFLEDLLDVLDVLAVGEEEDQLREVSGINISGTLIGQDPDTQITTIVSGQQVSLRRAVSDSARVDIDGSNSYTIIFIQDGTSNVVKINGGSDSTITITQSN
tara:strand:- start:3537 stop:4667 length:1131 start_codon:yes stop_codon:yes gene_type:complete